MNADVDFNVMLSANTDLAEFPDCDLHWLQRTSVYVLTEAGLIWIHGFYPC